MKHTREFDKLGDFTANARILPISLLAVAIGVIASFVALGLLRLIGFFTNLFYLHRLDSAGSLHAGPRLHRASAEAVHPHGKSGAARFSPQPRICAGPA
jgi:hypothetical protein